MSQKEKIMAKKKKVSSKSKSKKTSAVPERPNRPTLFIDSKSLKGDSLEVGKKVQVAVSGVITEESLRDYEAKGRKSYRLEIGKVKVVTKSKK